MLYHGCIILAWFVFSLTMYCVSSQRNAVDYYSVPAAYFTEVDKTLLLSRYCYGARHLIFVLAEPLNPIMHHMMQSNY